MENQLLFDKLAYVDRLIKSGINEGQARALSDALDEALRESVATKSDIAGLRSEIQLAVRDLKIWVGSIAVLLFGALVAVRFFVR